MKLNQKPEKKAEFVYVVTAYRWGCRDNHSYVVGVRKDKTKAIWLARHHSGYRGGKYGCAVEEFDLNAARESDPTLNQVAYISSTLGEKTLKLSRE